MRVDEVVEEQLEVEKTVCRLTVSKRQNDVEMIKKRDADVGGQGGDEHQQEQKAGNVLLTTTECPNAFQLPSDSNQKLIFLAGFSRLLTVFVCVCVRACACVRVRVRLCVLCVVRSFSGVGAGALYQLA